MFLFNSITDGVRQAKKNWRIIFIFYTVNLLLALLITVPLQSALTETVGQSLMGRQVLKEFNLAFIFEFLNQQPLTVPQLIQNVFYFSVIFVFVQTFLLGGTIKVFYARKQYFSSMFFFTGCLEYFTRFLKLFFVWFGIFIILIIFHFFAGVLIRYFTRSIDNEITILWLTLVRWGLLLLALLLVNLFMDYAKIITVSEDLPKILPALKATARFVCRHFGQTLLLYSTIGLIGVMAVVIYWPSSGWLQFENGLSVALVFLLRQIFILFRLGIRLLFYAAQQHLYVKHYFIPPPDDNDFSPDENEILLA
jgi:hypothetical protein